ncbi:aldo-keto reductase family 1 member B1-like [Saccoglossus kowalevskii]
MVVVVVQRVARSRDIWCYKTHMSCDLVASSFNRCSRCTTVAPGNMKIIARLRLTTVVSWCSGRSPLVRLVKSIGVSNFNHKQLDRILDIAKYTPVINQIEIHPYNASCNMIEWCKSREIAITSYSSFGGCQTDRQGAKEDDPNPLECPVVKTIAEKYGKTPAQVLLRFSIDRGCSVIPKSVNPKRMKENIEIFDFKLTSDDIKSVESFDRGWRQAEVSLWSLLKKHPHYPFGEDF